MKNDNKYVLERILAGFTSVPIVLVIFGVLICFLVPLSIFNETRSILLGPVKVLLALICLNLLLCTVRRLKTLRRSTLVIHIGSIMILIGGLISTFGFVATVNVYEGTTVDTVFNWDVEEDVPLGYDLRVASINMDFYPVGVKIGVLKNGRKADLVVTSTEDSFQFEKYHIRVLRLDPLENQVALAVESPAGEPVGAITTDGRRDIPADFPLDFKLVAFQDPRVKRMWVDLEVWKNGERLNAGTSEVNHPLKWQGMKFFLTQIAANAEGRPYAGIQISRDPGIPYVYTGFAVLFLGLLLLLKRWSKVVIKS